MNKHELPLADQLVDLGIASIETKGPPAPLDDSEGGIVGGAISVD